MVVYNFGSIAPVPEAKLLADVVLRRTQRKTPTVVHRHYHVSRLRSFYMRKVKFFQKEAHERLSRIISEFPRLDDVHPFYSQLMNVLYDRDHYRAALARLNSTRRFIDGIGREYVRLLKLKRAALGRMARSLRKLGDSLTYLEQVRQHLGRLPSVDPVARTLLVCGMPNVGKSSFVNTVTRADVEVQPYPFTTKSLFVGHTDYRYMRFQVIDTPGLLDHSLEERNAIEMQAITAMAHLRAAVLFFVDPTEECGSTIRQQLSLFNELLPLFRSRPAVLILSKSDLEVKLRPEDQPLLDEAIAHPSVDGKVVRISVFKDSESGIDRLKEVACEALIEQRCEAGQEVAVKRALEEETLQLGETVPESVKRSLLEPRPLDEQSTRMLEIDRQEMGGGAGVYSSDTRRDYLLSNPEWKYDTIPELVDGYNLSDWLQPRDHLEKELAELRAEEERRKNEDERDQWEWEQSREFDVDERGKEAVRLIKDRIAIMRIESALRRSRADRRCISATMRARTEAANARIGKKRPRNTSTH